MKPPPSLLHPSLHSCGNLHNLVNHHRRQVTSRSFSSPAFDLCGSGDGDNHQPSICTADELHYVSVNNSDWRLALWRYKPPPKVDRFSGGELRFYL